LRTNHSGIRNNAIGYKALSSNYWGDYNTAVGTFALWYSTGDRNTAIGDGALSSLDTGDGNIAVGHGAGSSLDGDSSGNIFIGSSGNSNDEDTIRIGHGGHDRTFLRGIRGTTTDLADAITVLIDSDGQLGTASSSEAVKQDVRSLGALSLKLAKLRPVSFRYRQQVALDPSAPEHFGLIAEEVAAVLPQLVVRDDQGRPTTVKYHQLAPLLLAELQSQRRQSRLLWGALGLVLIAATGFVVARSRRPLTRSDRASAPV
jgi:hypothetical protein